jgi:thiol-disulfide isomerase/thioredoxin
MSILIKKTINIFFLLLVTIASAQLSLKIEGKFAGATQKGIRLMGHSGTRDTLLSQSSTDNKGNFTLTYPKNYSGAASIEVKDMTSIIVLLNNEFFQLSWPDLNNFETLQFTNSQENEWFRKANLINTQSQKRLAGLNYLLPLYKNETLKKTWTKQLEEEIFFENNAFEKLKQEIPNFLYVKKYLEYRMLLQKLQQETKTIQEQTAIENAFNNLDFNSTSFLHSGLVKELCNEYLKQIIQIQDKDTVNQKLTAFADLIINKVKNNTKILNDCSEYLIKLYEQYGYTELAQNLALSLLNQQQCTIDEKTLPILEQYRKMVVGNIAPNLELDTKKYKSLQDVKATYKVIVFGASWCEACKQEIPQFKDYATYFKSKYDTEIIFIALDKNVEEFNNFTRELPFSSSCDFKGWDSPNVKNYYVFASPTIYILDVQNKIVSKPITAIETAKWLFENKNR